MRYSLLLILFCLNLSSVRSQINHNLELLAQVPVGEDGNDVWGYVDANGVEYAIMGTRTATRIFSLEDPSNPISRAVITGAPSIWRDMKSFEDHLYVTTDQGTDGLLIIDMSKAPDTITHNYWKPELTVGGVSETLETCHNLYVDPIEGYCYLAGCNVGVGGILIFDLNQDKDLPVYLSAANLNYSHDVYVKNDLMYCSEIYLGMFNVYDVSDKTNPILINGNNTSRNFTHNAWSSADQKYLFTTDERANAFVDAYDVSDLNDIKYLDSYQPLETEGLGVIPHNTHFQNNFLITSWYTDGIVITDATRPDNLINVGSYDTETNITGGFDGCWGAYPYLPSGIVLGSDINNGLFILQPVKNDGTLGYQLASYLEGHVTDVNTGNPIQNVNVEILSSDKNRGNTNIMGEYKTGQVTAGTFDVVFSHPNYDSKTFQVVLISGEVTILDVQLGGGVLSGKVVDFEGNDIAFAKVVVNELNQSTPIDVIADENGAWSVGVRTNKTYQVLSAKWGYKGRADTIEFTTNEVVESVLANGYEDDFFTDLGWEVTGNASSGNWELAIPNRISLDNSTLSQTDMDVDDDLGLKYYVTAASGATAGEQDIDNGSVILTSPSMDFSMFEFIEMDLSLWFVNGGGNGSAPNDYVKVSVISGNNTYEIINETQSMDQWVDHKFIILPENIPFTDDMRVVVTASDDDPGHVVEAGLDAFYAEGKFTVATSDVIEENITLSPNPAHDMLTIRSDVKSGYNTKYMIIDNRGRVVMQSNNTDDMTTIDIRDLSQGIYQILIESDGKLFKTSRFVKD